MSLFERVDLKHYMDYVVKKDDSEKMSKVSAVNIKHIRINDLVEYIYKWLDPRNNLRDPTVKIAFDALPEENRKFLATSMLIYRYCIHRIVTLFEVYDIANWQYHLTDDYYSQEVSSITMKPELARKVDSALRYLITLSDTKKIEYILKLEFNRVLPEVQNKTWSIESVHIDELYFSNRALFDKCVKEDSSYLENYKLPRGLCIKEKHGESEYRVIDGYHRLADITKTENKRCLIIYCD